MFYPSFSLKHTDFLKVGHNEDYVLYFHLASVYANRGEEALLDIDHCLWDQCRRRVKWIYRGLTM